jgi:hypothetical protein
MPLRRTLRSQLTLLLCLSLVSCLPAMGQDAPEKHGRKYKAPPATSHIQVTVPISNAAVIFDATLDGKDQGNLEVKTDPDGKATIDIIPTGSTVRVQVIATGFATYAEDYVVAEPSREITVSMIHPKEQLSSYQDNEGKAATRKPGVQEPVRPTKPATKPPAPAPAAPTTPQQPPNSDTTPKQ